MSYSFAEMQSVYFKAPADWVRRDRGFIHFFKRYESKSEYNYTNGGGSNVLTMMSQSSMLTITLQWLPLMQSVYSKQKKKKKLQGRCMFKPL